MMKVVDSVEDLFMITVIGHQTCAIPVYSVHEMIPMPKVSSIPGSGAYVRGVVNLRGSVLPLFDMRSRLGMPSCTAETETYVEMMNTREADHRNWLEELERSVTEKRSFNLATEPHQCAFGKWYYSYDTKSGSNRCMGLDLTLQKFEGPHDKIHGIAEKVLALEETGDFKGALALIEKTRQTDLMKMIALFDEARTAIVERRRELAMVIETEGKKKALAVDAVDSVDKLDFSGQIEAGIDFTGGSDPIVAGIARRQKDDSLVVLLNLDHLTENQRLHSEATH